MERNSRPIKDALATFREYMRLERRRTAGFSSEEWARWQVLRERLDNTFGNFSSTGDPDRRATPRIPTALVLQFENLGEVGKLLICNLSRGGIFVPTKRPAPIGTELKLCIEVATPSREIVLIGDVVSHHIGPDFEFQPPGMGIRFKSLNENDQALIDELYEEQIERHFGSD